MGKLLDRYCRLLDMLMALALVAMILMVFGNVVLRYAFNSGITVSEELARWLLVWMTFLGAVVALRERAHLGTDVLVARLPRPARRLCLILGQALMLYATWLLLAGSWMQAEINWRVLAPASGLPMAVVYGAGVFFGLSALVILAHSLARALFTHLPDGELVMIRDSEELEPVETLHLEHSLERPARA